MSDSVWCVCVCVWCGFGLLCIRHLKNQQCPLESADEASEDGGASERPRSTRLEPLL